MTLPPLFGDTAPGWNVPDPIVWWFVAPVLAYYGALIIAIVIAKIIEWKD